MLVALTLSSAFTVFNVAPSQAAEETSSWKTMALMPSPRGGFGVAVVNGKIYAIGGLNNGNPLSVNEEYNPATNEWTTKASMPTPRSGFAITVYDNKIYVIGGTVGVGDGYLGNNEVYDPLTDTWQTKVSLPTPRADLSAEVVDGKMYLIGGKRYSSQSPNYIETNLNEVYDPSNNTWGSAAAIPTGVQGYASAVVNGKIYIMGGSRQPSSLGNTIIVNNNQVYDPKTDTWSLAAGLPSVTSYGTAAATEGIFAPQLIYYVGGFVGGDFSDKAQTYNPANNSWSIAEKMPTARAYLGLAVVNDVLYAIGGFDGTNWLSTNEQFKPVGYGTVPPQVQITSPENKTYAEVTLSYKTNKATSWLGYSLDNQANVTLNSEVQLPIISQGSHSVVIYANDSAGNMGVSNAVYFSVDTLAPEIHLVRPKNASYDSSDIQLSFVLDENVTYLAYSLDGQPKKDIAGNITLPALSNGGHRITLYATDAFGNGSQETVYFTIAPFPMVEVVAALVTAIILVLAGIVFFKFRKSKAT